MTMTKKMSLYGAQVPDAKVIRLRSSLENRKEGLVRKVEFFIKGLIPSSETDINGRYKPTTGSDYTDLFEAEIKKRYGDRVVGFEKPPSLISSGLIDNPNGSGHFCNSISFRYVVYFRE